MDALEITSTHSSELDGSSTMDDDKGSDGAFTERVRVDRRKLEEMLQENDPGQPTPADGFFTKIMDETDAHISWPSKLKVGAKSKKDPHVKVSGPPEAIAKAREKILQVLDTKRHRVTLKMDVSFTDHSYIIGRGGHIIQRVMDDTECHIHFPDSNRSSRTEKSNQVSIAGQPAGVEKARAQIRELLPMMLSFELPLSALFHLALDPASSVLQELQRVYGIAVTFRHFHPNLTRVMVKGCRRNVDSLRQGLLVLTDYLTGGARTPMLVTLTTEIAPQHHGFVMGRGNSNIHHITQLTGCTITFPTPSPSELSRNSTVSITGHFDGVFAAWVEILGRLPLALMFDLKEAQDVDMLVIAKLMEHLNVNIAIKPKPKRNSKCIIVRGQERDSRKLFEVRRVLLQLETDELGDPPISLASALLYSLGADLEEQLRRELKADPGWPNVTPSHFMPQQQAMLLPLLLNQMGCYGKGAPPPWTSPPFSNWRDLERTRPASDKESSRSSGVSCTSPSPRESPVSPPYEDRCKMSDKSWEEGMSGNNSGWSPPQFGSVGCERKVTFGSSTLDYDSRKLLATKAMQEPVAGCTKRVPTSVWVGQGFSKSMPECMVKESIQASGFPRLHESKTMQTTMDRSPPGCESWPPDLGTSVSDKRKMTLADTRESAFSFSNLFDGLRTRSTLDEDAYRDLPHLFSHLGLSKYINVFEQNEIDLPTFLIMTDSDLQKLCIPYGAKKKMLLAISDLNQQKFPRSFHAAPGAERRVLHQ